MWMKQEYCKYCMKILGWWTEEVDALVTDPLYCFVEIVQYKVLHAAENQKCEPHQSYHFVLGWVGRSTEVMEAS